MIDFQIVSSFDPQQVSEMTQFVEMDPKHRCEKLSIVLFNPT